jgi:hypothetical protein
MPSLLHYFSLLFDSSTCLSRLILAVLELRQAMQRRCCVELWRQQHLPPLLLLLVTQSISTALRLLLMLLGIAAIARCSPQL